uniref:Uncharacterized protein n=1 Tax=Cacopsylla melanoneura TaxID=428564 RepID=A0A8D8TN27_9HEMI
MFFQFYSRLPTFSLSLISQLFSGFFLLHRYFFYHGQFVLDCFCIQFFIFLFFIPFAVFSRSKFISAATPAFPLSFPQLTLLYLKHLGLLCIRLIYTQTTLHNVVISPFHVLFNQHAEYAMTRAKCSNRIQ